MLFSGKWLNTDFKEMFTLFSVNYLELLSSIIKKEPCNRFFGSQIVVSATISNNRLTLSLKLGNNTKQ